MSRHGSAARSGISAPTVALVALLVLVAVGTTWALLTLFRPASDERMAPPSRPTIVSSEELREIASAVGTPVYWLGDRPGQQLEATVSDSGSVYLRYLPDGVAAGVEEPHLTIATYMVAEAYSSLAGADQERATVSRTENGAVVVAFNDYPSSAYLAFSDSSFQVEVFSPDEGEAFSLAEGGSVERVR